MITDENRIIETEYTEEMSKSYIDYAMSVIVSRAVPDVRDGLKPVQRRVIYDMHELGINSDKPYRKSARIVGDTMGKYHPHGDSSIYEALVVMTQDFKKEAPLIDGHGNFGSIEGDGAAAMRYTEARLQKITQEVYLEGLEKNMVDFKPNFDETEKEPSVLPVKIPNMLINGSEGIAVGMTTSTPSHNLAEVLDAECALLDNPKLTVADLMQYVQGPDWPTGGEVINKKDLLEIYETGVGKIRIRAKVDYEPGRRKSDKDRLIISEIPYTMIGSALPKFFSDLSQLMENRTLTEISDVTNASDKDGIRIILELKKGADVNRVKNILFTKTKLEDTFGVNMLAIANNRPDTMSLKTILEHHINFLYEINTRKYKYLLKKEEDRKEIFEGLIRAVDVIDIIIEILRGSKNVKDVKKCLTKGIIDDITFRTKSVQKKAATFDFTERQADAILEMKLQKLIGLEILSLEKSYQECLNNISNYTKILKSKTVLKNTIKKELNEIKKKYSKPRKTLIIDAEAGQKVKVEDVKQDVYFLMNRFGYAKNIDVPTYERNKENLEEYKYIIDGSTEDKLLIFTNYGNMYQIKLDKLPLCKIKDKGIPIENFIKKKNNEEDIIAILTDKKIRENNLIFITKTGLTKSVPCAEFETNTKAISCTKLADGDELLYADIAKDDISIETTSGVIKRIRVKDVKECKKTAKGVQGFKMKKGDLVKKIVFEEK